MRLHLYLSRKAVVSFLAVLGIFVTFTVLLGLADQARRFAGEEISFLNILSLSLLATPGSVYALLPLIMAISTLAMFLRLARTSELVVMRSAGRSAIRSLVAPCAVAVAFGALAIVILNPVVAATSKEYEARSALWGGEQTSVLSVTGEGVWLRQGSAVGQTVIRAEGTNLDGTRLNGATFLSFTTDGTPLQRIDAKEAELSTGGWQMRDAKIWPLEGASVPEAEARRSETLFLPSDLTRERIRDSFGTPSAIPIWDLPEFISRLNAAGFSARRHAVWFHMELATPAFMVAMVLIAAGFTMRHSRVTRTGPMILGAILTAFALYFLRNFAQILGENGQMPILLAAWVPPMGAIGLALGLLLHTEDG